MEYCLKSGSKYSQNLLDHPKFAKNALKNDSKRTILKTTDATVDDIVNNCRFNYRDCVTENSRHCLK